MQVDTEEGSGDSDEINGGKEGNMDFSVDNESRSPPYNLQTTQTRKGKSKGNGDGSSKRRNQNINNCLGVLNKVLPCEVQSLTPLAPLPPSATKKFVNDKIYDKLCECDQVKMRGMFTYIML